MANEPEDAAASTPLLSENQNQNENENENETSAAQNPFECVVYQNSSHDCDSMTVSGSTVNNDDPLPSSLAFSSTKDQEVKINADAISDLESLPEYLPMAPEYESAFLSGKDGYHAENLVGNNEGYYTRCKQHGCVSPRRTSIRCDKKRRARRRFIFFIKAFVLFGLFSFVVTRLCLRHRMHKKVSIVPIFSENSTKDFIKDSQTSREIKLDKGSGIISGRYPLYDLLSLKTTSGNINIVVDPQQAHPDHPDEPARLVVETKSGSVSVTFLQYSMDIMVTFGSGNSKRVDDVIDIEYLKTSGATSVSQVKGQIPYRPYEIEVKTETGSINGRFIFTTSAYLKTQSGTISASLVPIISPDVAINAHLVTETDSGAQSISISEPLIIDVEGAALNNARKIAVASLPLTTSSHTTDSGTIQVIYPHSWAGTVEANTSSGWIGLGGDGLEVTEQTQRHAAAVKYSEQKKRQKWWGSRGDMDVNLKSTGSGSIQFYIKDRSSPAFEDGVGIYSEPEEEMW